MGDTQPSAGQRRWHLAGVSARGLSHIKAGMPCQDSHVCRELAGGAVVIAVADGAGSAALSQLGSARAALAAVEWVEELLQGGCPAEEAEWRALLTATLETAHESVLNAARKRNVTPRELATTLIVLIATPTCAAAVQVGDGAAVVATADNRLVALTVPQRGEFVNETRFFTAPEYLESAHYGFFRGPVTGLGALSDGLQLLALKMPEATPHPAFFLPLLAMLSQTDDIHYAENALRDFLGSDRIRQRADDDLTLVLATLQPAPVKTSDHADRETAVSP